MQCILVVVCTFTNALRSLHVCRQSVYPVVFICCDVLQQGVVTSHEHTLAGHVALLPGMWCFVCQAHLGATVCAAECFVWAKLPGRSAGWKAGWLAALPSCIISFTCVT